MAKLTLTGLQSIVAAVIADNKIGQDAPFNITVDSLSGLLIKVGKQFMLGSQFEDRLPEMEGDYLPYGSTIEEYFVDLRLPVDFDPDGATNSSPKRPTYQDVAYSYELVKKTFDMTIDDNKWEHAMLGEAELSAFAARLLENLYKAQALYKYGAKRQLIGRYISNIPAISGTKTMLTVGAIPTNTTTGEDWIKSVKKQIEALSLLITEKNNINGVPARAEELILYIKPNITPVIDVDVLAGAFNTDKVILPVEIKVLEDFGTITNPSGDTTYDRTGAWAILVDKRAMKIHTVSESIKTADNGQGDFRTWYLHYQPTAHYSKSN